MATHERFEATLVKKETTYASDPTPGTTDAVRLKDRLWMLLKARHVFENRNDDLVSNSLIAPKIGIPHGSIVDFELPWHARGKGSIYTAADTDIEGSPLLQACGLSVALNSGVLTFSPAESGHASCAMYGYAGGDRAKVVGIRGNWRWPFNAGVQAKMMFAMTGMFLADPDAQSVPSASYDATDAPVAVGCGFTLNPGTSYVPKWSEGEFDLGNKVEPIEDANGADGLAGIEITGREPKFTCTIQKDLLSSFSPRSIYKAVTSTLIDLTVGGTQYNRFALDVNESYIAKDPEPVTYRGFTGWKLTMDVKQIALLAN
jgi:hypothetical protein